MSSTPINSSTWNRKRGVGLHSNCRLHTLPRNAPYGYFASGPSARLTRRLSWPCRAPDVSFVAADRLDGAAGLPWLALCPDLAAEVVSPDASARQPLDTVGE